MLEWSAVSGCRLVDIYPTYVDTTIASVWYSWCGGCSVPVKIYQGASSVTLQNLWIHPVLSAKDPPRPWVCFCAQHAFSNLLYYGLHINPFVLLPVYFTENQLHNKQNIFLLKSLPTTGPLDNHELCCFNDLKKSLFLKKSKDYKRFK